MVQKREKEGDEQEKEYSLMIIRLIWPAHDFFFPNARRQNFVRKIENKHYVIIIE
jgi:hypothetical protein